MSELDIKSREGYSDTMKALEYAADGGLIEESEIDRDFYTLTREKGAFKDGYEVAVVDFLKSTQEGKRSVCVTEGALKALGVQTDSPRDYCPAPEAPTPVASEPPPPAPPPAPDVAPAPTPLRPLPPLFRNWLAGRGTVPAVTPAPAPDAAPIPDVTPTTDEEGKKKVAVEKATKKVSEAEADAKRAAQAADIAQSIVSPNEAQKPLIKLANSEVEKAAQAVEEAKKALEATKAAPTSSLAEAELKKVIEAATKAKKAADAAVEASRKATEAATTTSGATTERQADLSKAVRLSELSSAIRSGRTLQIDLRKKTIRGAEGEEFFPEGTAEGYIPGADPEKVFMALIHLEEGARKMSDGKPMIPDWVDTKVENRPADYKERLLRGENIPMTHTLWMQIPPNLNIQSTVNYWRIRNNLNGTYELRWRETTLKHARGGYDPLAKNQGSWLIKAVVDETGKVVGTYIQYALWTDPAITSSFKKKNGGSDSDKWRLGKGAFKMMSAIKIPLTFSHIAEKVGSGARFSARVSCTRDLREDPVWEAMEICK